MKWPIVDDDLRTLIEPLPSRQKPLGKSHQRPPRLSDRTALNRILFVMKTGMLEPLTDAIRVRLSSNLMAASARLAGSRRRDRLHELTAGETWAHHVSLHVRWSQ
jgi:hypothetical protein